MAINYTVTSFSEKADGSGGQITVTVGEGRNRRSFTRHLNRGMLGLHIDKRAHPLNEKYEQELAEAQAEMASAENMFSKLLKEREDIINVEAEGHVVTDEVKAQLEETLDSAEETLIEAKATLDDAEVKLRIVQRELPLMMRFDRY